MYYVIRQTCGNENFSPFRDRRSSMAPLSCRCSVSPRLTPCKVREYGKSRKHCSQVSGYPLGPEQQLLLIHGLEKCNGELKQKQNSDGFPPTTELVEIALDSTIGVSCFKE